ncbi:MAG: hypothetical protein R3F20_02150 [Planctomycetota bacterium]
MKELRRAIDLLLERVETTRGESFVLGCDSYWHVHQMDAFKLGHDAPPVVLGSLRDDVDHLARIAKGGAAPIPQAAAYAAHLLLYLADDDR